MKNIFSSILLLVICQIAIGQIPGTPKIMFKSAYPQTFTISATTSDISSANLTSYVIDNGQTQVTESGILWGTSTPTYISSTNGNVATTNSNTGTITCTLSGLTPGINYFIVAYAITTAGTTYGNVISYEHAVVVSPVTGKKWMAVNLGANNYPANIDDQTGAGDMYQWGRFSDGHEKARPLVYLPEQYFNQSGNYVPLWVPANGHRYEWSSSSTVQPLEAEYYENEKDRYHRLFIIDRTNKDVNDPDGYNGGNVIRGTTNPTTPNTVGDWLTNFNNNLWQGLNGINNPCPSGFRIPTATEFENETALQSKTTAFASFLKLPNTGFRSNDTRFGRSNIQQINTGYYWTSNTIVSSGNKSIMIVFSTNRSRGTSVRATGAAVRCIKD
jgi:hypothetical protein